jgi:hypothetical protein
MPTFQEFLKERATELRLPERRRQRDEWLAAVQRLQTLVKGWLGESDPAGLLDIGEYTSLAYDGPYGHYDVPALKITLGGPAVHVVPTGLNTIRSLEPFGRPDLRPAGHVALKIDGVTRHALYRVVEDGQDRWYIVNDRYQAVPFDRERLEAILQSEL